MIAGQVYTTVEVEALIKKKNQQFVDDLNAINDTEEEQTKAMLNEA